MDITKMTDDEVICNCMGVTLADIKTAVADGATTFEEVQEVTSVSTGCGGCEDVAREVVAELTK